jgi:hypothetical protein
MIRESNIAVIAAVAAFVLASPALAQSIPGYGPQGNVIVLGQRSNTHQKFVPNAESVQGLHDTVAAPSEGFGFQSDGVPWNGANMGNIGR